MGWEGYELSKAKSPPCLSTAGVRAVVRLKACDEAKEEENEVEQMEKRDERREKSRLV